MTQGWTSKAYDEYLEKVEDILRTTNLSLCVRELEKQGYRFEGQLPYVYVYHSSLRNQLHIGRVDRKKVTLNYKESLDTRFDRPRLNMPQAVKDVLYFREILRARKIPCNTSSSLSECNSLKGIFLALNISLK